MFWQKFRESNPRATKIKHEYLRSRASRCLSLSSPSSSGFLEIYRDTCAYILDLAPKNFSYRKSHINKQDETYWTKVHYKRIIAWDAIIGIRISNTIFTCMSTLWNRDSIFRWEHCESSFQFWWYLFFFKWGYKTNAICKWLEHFLIKMQSVIKVLSLTKTQEIGHLFYRARSSPIPICLYSQITPWLYESSAKNDC